MHGCLYIPEILTAIFEYLLYDVENYKQTLQRRNLLALVKTCRTFYRPALALLWRVLFNPAPLLLTMPRDLIDLERKEEGDVYFKPRTLKFKRHVVNGDWKRFDFYAPFVKELAEVTEGNDRSPTNYIVLDPHICHELQRRNTVLLPNLKTILSSTDGLAYIPAFLISRVQQLGLVMHPNHFTSLVNIFIDLDRNAPTIKSLRMQQSTAWKTHDITLFNDIHPTRLRGLNLEEFVCDWLPLTDETTKCLLSMPALRSLSIRKDAGALVRILRSQPLQTPQITAFDLHSEVMNDGLNSLATVLSLLLPSKLTRFCVTSESTCYGVSELTELLRAVGTHCSPALLSEFVLDRSHSINTHDNPFVDFKMLEPLLPFSNLRKLWISDQAFFLTDTEVKTFAMSWPHLEDLFFDSHGPGIPNPCATLRGLLWVAIYCRKLHALTFNFTDVNPSTKVILPQEDIDRAEGHKLVFLTVGNSPIDDPKRVSSFLNRVFPKLSMLVYSTDHQVIDDLWSEVENQLME